MDGQVTRCAQCGAPSEHDRPLLHQLRCPRRLGASAPPPPEPTYDDERDAASGCTPYRTSRRTPPPADPSPERPPFAEPAADAAALRRTGRAPTGLRRPDYAQPVYADPPPPRRSPGVGLWIGAAAGLVLVLVLGGLPAPERRLRRRQPVRLGDPARPEAPAHQHASPDDGRDVVRAAHGADDRHRPARRPTWRACPGRAHRRTPPRASTSPASRSPSWRPTWSTVSSRPAGARPGDATGTVLTFRLDRPTTITKVGLINGYAKTAFSGGRRYDWYQGDRRVLSVDWVFDDGTTVSQTFSETRAMQSRTIPPVTTSTVQVRITAVSPPGQRAGVAQRHRRQRGVAGRLGVLTVRGAPARRRRPSRPRRSRRGA